ncbi:hypothetical protein ACFFRR_000994 [Megaselia abdita]
MDKYGFSFPQNDDKEYLSDDEATYEDNDDEHADHESASSGEQNKPYFSVKGVNQTFIPDKDVVLDCPVHDLGSKTVIVWYREVEAITNGATALKPKYKVVGGTKLTIISAVKADEGSYSCTILPYTNISLKFNLVVGSKNEVLYDGKSGASFLSVSGAFLTLAIAAVFLKT